MEKEIGHILLINDFELKSSQPIHFFGYFKH